VAAAEGKLSACGNAFLDNLVRARLLTGSLVKDFVHQNAPVLGSFSKAEPLGQALVNAGLLTSYQLGRVMAGATHGLVLGNYRILNRLGAGGMGVVFRAQHIFLQREAALKVLPMDDDCTAELLERFYTEMQVLAQLHHPNIVMAYDAGCCAPPAPGFPTLVYLAMELIDGCDLEEHVQKNGSPSVADACTWISQAARGLQEAHDHKLIHRDIKPSNLLLPKRGQVKLSDFGLVRQYCSRLTDPNALMGTLCFMPPEQSIDPSSVGSYADIYGLGASLFWLLTKQGPYPCGRTVNESLKILQQGRPRRLRELRADVPQDLEEFVAGLVDPDPTQRPAVPLTVVRGLARFAGT
jgi:serine/threonine protein kinase